MGLGLDYFEGEVAVMRPWLNWINSGGLSLLYS